MSVQAVRVRFAPSPTGPLHIGGVRTALFNYLFARKNNGTFLLRIEDTDRARYVAGAEQYIIDSLQWCGIQIDEGVTAGGPFAPYRQSERKHLYGKYAQMLVDHGYAYLAFDAPGELERLRKEAESNKSTFTYDALARGKLDNSLALDEKQVRERLAAGLPYVIRYKMPEDHRVGFTDVVRGEVEVNTRTLDDKILLKADGMPTYHLANVVDDHLMEISHVIRGEEWLPSTPLHILLYEAFGWQDTMPIFAHMPLTLKPDGKGKLSKRDGDRLGFPVFPIEWKDPRTGDVSSGYREAGYFPEAFINILALLGWNPGTDQELFSVDELIEAFSLERIVKAGSRFDPEKAKWFNHQYLIRKNGDELAAWFTGELDKRGIEAGQKYVSQALEMVKERASLLTDLWEKAWFFFLPPAAYDEKVIKKIWKDDSGSLLRELGDSLASLEPFTTGRLEPVMVNLAKNHGIGLGNLMSPLRLALVGSNIGPGLLDIMEMLGKKEVLRRIDRALHAIP
jgi:glutamyl-tRNA synthetase